MPRTHSQPMTRLSMRQLLLISAIDDNGSLKRASELIGMSQPRATKALQEAEEITGTKLFNRTNRGLNPTHAGESMIRHAKTILSQLKEMEEELRTASDSGWAKLRIGTIMGAVPYLTETISTYLRRFPRTSFEILEDTSVELFRQLDRGMLDLIIGRSSMIATPQLYHVTAFHDERLAVVANPAHPLIGRTRVRLTDLEDARWIVYTAAMPMRLLLEQEFRQAGLGMPRGLMETRSALTTISLIQADPNTVALLSSDVAAFFVNFGMASVLPMHLRSKSEPYELITRRSVELPPHALAFIEDLVAGATTRL
ncbi:LysR family transcriptional regulator [Sulfitobacter pseudonitzschiae]|uniref:LysR family transcriptional regulator n=2 Tax=Pseudosulfitobacter pseudonitzschiae TaxID=1402135 RepID=UPI001AF0E394|nr:LysR family transcriptional regulator [Pseudosulfitobacter pseudonitzschiae]MBM1816680.1 LysR family transcriptional regulator [Pseudosulfitobacter pseudonitzschiae]MBM1833490.1 LysR family transcriptional regulator [Pseudosulfitobacter pseudonitzschiae]MBM1838357.1 LysR family transcriptional regulator [Pseudosulfitobacter pseudonitzschiae]MBM1843407.1 LysR family transcriptional regulator [Pseudosulfitobacter pseudonitzschiae]MBM1848273.1 LysR family transcriptional regulator [Pseudosulfi